MKNKSNQINGTNSTNNDVVCEIIGFYVSERISKNGNKYKCIVAVDENDGEHFICFTK